MIIYRLFRTQYSRDLTGTGIRMAGGRLNDVGRAMACAEQNMLIDPAHPDIKHIRIVDVDSFEFDPLLVR